MIPGEKPVGVSMDASFTEVVDEACEKLKDRQVRYSIRRIHEMEGRLSALEQELDDFLIAKDGK